MSLIFIFLLTLSTTILSQKSKIPVILVPGFQTNQLTARFDENANISSIDECRKYVGSDNFTIWLSSQYLVGHPVNCVVDGLMQTYDEKTRTTNNYRGVHIEVPAFGSTSSFEYVDQQKLFGSAFITMVRRFLQYGYEHGKTLFGAPYDFRKGPSEQKPFFEKLKTLIEEVFRKNKRRVLLIPHSLGGQYILIFLQGQTQKWKDTYVQGVIFLSSATGGDGKAMYDYLAGLNLTLVNQSPETAPDLLDQPPETAADWLSLIGVPVPKELHLSPSLLHSYSSTPPLFPWPTIWSPVFALVQTYNKVYSLSNIEEFFKDFNITNGWEIYKDNYPYVTNIKEPGVDAHCLYGTGIATLETTLVIGVYPNANITATGGDGDGIVNLRSLEVCKRWLGGHKKVTIQPFLRTNHSNILRSRKVFASIIKIIEGYN